MKVCIFTETYYPVIGGGETQARLLAESLIADEHGAIILTRRSDALLRVCELYGNIIVYRLLPSGGGQFKKWGLLFSSPLPLIKLRDQYDLVFVSGYRIIGLVAVLVAKLLRKPVVLKADSQGEMSGEFFESGLRKFGTSRSSLMFRLFLFLRNVVLKKANAFVAISPEIASELAATGVPADKIIQIPNCVDTNRFCPVNATRKLFLRRRLGLPEHAAICIYTGRLVSYKGLPLLLQVWNEVRNKHKDTLLVLVGTGGLDIHNCEEELRNYVRSSGLEQSILFTGAIQNVSEYLQAADIFIFPTENDAFPSALIEAMACGLPVITTPVGAIKTIISSGENGILVNPGNFAQLSGALELVLADKTLIVTLGQTAREMVQAQYSEAIIARQYVSLFHKTLQHSEIMNRTAKKKKAKMA